MAGSVSIETKACSHPTPTSRLSEENLRRHNVEFQKLDNHYQMDQSHSAVQAADAVSYDQVDGDMDDIDIDSDMPDSEIALRRKASLDVLKLYSGALASLTTPMSRFVDMKPTRISRSWITKNVMDEPAIAGGEADTHDLRTLVSDMVDVAHAGVQSDTWDAGRRVCGSPRPDSDTLSNPDINDLEPEAKRAMHTKHIGIAKRSRLDRMKIPRSVPTSAMA